MEPTWEQVNKLLDEGQELEGIRLASTLVKGRHALSGWFDDVGKKTLFRLLPLLEKHGIYRPEDIPGRVPVPVSDASGHSR